jgi:HAE1 family hydrophobic/amphiphilic exporter-1
VFLVMAVLFESFVLPLVIMISVPVAGGRRGGAGGPEPLSAQPLDMLTLLGFVILVGIVVNNAILIWRTSRSITCARRAWPVSRRFWRPPATDPADLHVDADLVFGMLPLVVFPGAGSELYRGLGSVVVGGLSLSAVLTLLIVPPLLRLPQPFSLATAWSPPVRPRRNPGLAAHTETTPSTTRPR